MDPTAGLPRSLVLLQSPVFQLAKSKQQRREVLYRQVSVLVHHSPCCRSQKSIQRDSFRSRGGRGYLRSSLEYWILVPVVEEGARGALHWLTRPLLHPLAWCPAQDLERWRLAFHTRRQQYNININGRRVELEMVWDGHPQVVVASTAPMGGLG